MTEPEPDDTMSCEEMIFDAAVQLKDPASRAACLERACGSDAALRARLDKLLAADQAGDSLFAQPLASPAMLKEAACLSTGPAPGDADTEKPGDRIGRYKLLEKIGEGGCGVVYMAEQEEPLRRKVALKIIKPGMDSKSVIARFEAERQALAMMDHPNIAKIHDGGVSGAGRPFFVMELVRGVRITQYCQEHQLAIRDRLDLFTAVCSAVQHAHQKGIIHRDLKPSNVLVTEFDGKPVPKVIDFGIARATEQNLTDNTLFTQIAQFLGTPAYMSPEQAAMTSLDIDTRSDIYALGVLLYELLTGHTPFDAKELLAAGLDEMRRVIREMEPPKPSTRLTQQRTASRMAGADQSALSTPRSEPSGAKRNSLGADPPTRADAGASGNQPAESSTEGIGGSREQIDPDLDWIVMKALEKDRTRRYDTAAALAEDLRRHLACEPVVARPPSPVYRFRRLLKRNKLVYAAGSAIALALLIGMTASVWQARRAQHEAARAKAAQQSAVATLSELTATAPAFAEQARALATHGRLDEAIEKLSYAVKLQPAVPEYLVQRADFLRAELRLAEAAASYRAALRVDPKTPRAEMNAAFCERLLAEPAEPNGKLSLKSLSELLRAMEQEQRPAAELMPVAQLLGAGKKLFVEYWTPRLKQLALSAGEGQMSRLFVREDGLLALNLANTQVTDLTPLAAIPLGVLDLNGTNVADLSLLADMPLRELDLGGCAEFSDLAPVRKLRALRVLNLSRTKASDLSPLRGLALESLDLNSCPVSDISPLEGMRLKTLDLSRTQITDLSPLAGMPLIAFTARQVERLTDCSLLAGAPLEFLDLQDSKVKDLSFLRDSPVRTLILFRCLQTRGFGTLAELKSLRTLGVPGVFSGLPESEVAAIGTLRHHPTLERIHPDLGITELRNLEDAPNSPKIDQSFWARWDRDAAFLSVLRKSGFPFTVTMKSPDTYAVKLHARAFSDLSILKDAPIVALSLTQCKVTDLTPLRKLPLRSLNLNYNPVADLGPLDGMPLKTLELRNTAVSDLTPLRSVPLEGVDLCGCKSLGDVSALVEIPTLQRVWLPANATGIESLRALPDLKINVEGPPKVATSRESQPGGEAGR